MNKKDTITIFQMILLLMTAIGLKNHVIVIPPLIKDAGRDAWISVLAMGGITLVWGILFFYIYKSMKGVHIQTWLQETLGKAFTNILIYIVIIQLLVMATVTLKETIMWTNVSYLLKTPPLVLTIAFIIPCMLAAMTQLRTIIITNFFFLALVIIFGFFVAFTNIQFKNYALLLPIMEHGYKPVVKAMVYQGTGMVELIVVLVLQHRFKSEFKYRHFIVLVILLTILTLGPLIGAIVEFGPKQAALQRYPAFEEWGLARLGKYVEHVDYLSIYQWLSGAFIRTTLLLFIIRILLNKKSDKVNKWVIVASCILLTGLVAFPVDEKMFFDLLMSVFLPLTFWFLSGLSLLLGVLAFVKRRKQRGNVNVEQNETR